MTTTPTRKRKSPHGAPLRFVLDEALSHRSDDCLPWPFTIVGKGYGSMRYAGKVQGSHRVICLLAHGSAPTPRHEVAHSCRRKDCSNPRHLRWATPKENNADKIAHRTDNKGEKHGISKLTENDVREIRRLKENVSQAELARRFGVSASAIHRVIHGVLWGWLK